MTVADTYGHRDECTGADRTASGVIPLRPKFGPPELVKEPDQEGFCGKGCRPELRRWEDVANPLEDPTPPVGCGAAVEEDLDAG